MADEDQRLLEEAKQSREETQEVREEAGLGRDADPGEAPPQQQATDAPDGEPWAKTSSGDADDVTDDE